MKYSALLFTRFVLFGCVLFFGCSQPERHKQDSDLVIKPTLTADCMAQYYRANGSAYMTRQQHGFNPIAGYFQMTAQEPTGNTQYTLLKEKYTESKQKTVALSDIPVSFCTQSLAAGIYYSFCAGGELLDTASLSGENVKLEGKWYQPLTAAWPSGAITITLLRSLDTNRVELVRVDDSAKGTTWLLRNYNIRYSKELEKNLPRKIDVFDIRNGIASKQLMIQFEYSDIQITQNKNSAVGDTNLTAD
jgi:hypothetical protein